MVKKVRVDSDRRSLLLGAAAVVILSLPVSAIADTMNQPKGDTTVRAGTVTEPRFYEGLDYSEEGFSYRIRHYTHVTDAGLVVGLVASAMFTIDAPSSEVWPYLKDFNSFEGPYCIHYTGVWGDLYTSETHDLGQETLQYQGIGWSSVPSRVLRVIPEHLLTLFETIPEDGSTDGMSPGFHTFFLNGHDGKTVVTAIMEHAERMKGMTEEEALDRSMWGPKRYDNSASMKRWRDQFVPTIRELVSGKRERMNQPKGDTTVRAGTVTEPRFYEGLDYSEEGFSYRIRHYTHMTDGGPVVGLVASAMFTIDAPSNEVWPYLKDFNSFEGPYGIYYTGVWGDLYASETHDLGQETLRYGAGRRTTSIGLRTDWSSVPSRVLRVIPEHLLTLFETIPEDGSTDGMSPGFHVFMLNGYDGKTVVTAIMEHSERMKGMTEEEARDRSRWGPKLYDNSESMKRWRDQFVPTIKELVSGKRERN
ncbi:MAG: hypothetical protein C3F08_04355 [Candidatus Methylomirabilota bacterium]|nr:MAG: hypothetical protein C3F08_04355 [candidate division NC10 bacterium]